MYVNFGRIIFIIQLFLIFAVPAPVLNISLSRENGVYEAGTALNITCEVDEISLDFVDNLQISSVFNWTNNGNQLEVNERVFIKNELRWEGRGKSSVVFSSLSSAHDTGTYFCSAFASTNKSSFIQKSEIAASEIISFGVIG